MDCIKNIEDVRRFFRYLYTERKVAFHPDENFYNYVSWEDGSPTFTSSECEKFERFMDESFAICKASEVDIYNLACELRDNFATA